MNKARGSALGLGVVVFIAASASAAAQVASQSGPAAATPATPALKGPATFGTSHDSYYQIPSSEFLPFESARTYTTSNFGVFNLGRYATSGPSDFNAPIHLPSGALITYLELDYCDTAGNSNHVLGTLVECDWTGQTCTEYPSSGTSVTGWLTSADGSQGCTNVHIDMTPFNVTVNNYLTHYQLDAETYATDGTNAITGMLVGYRLQVQPAPGSPTFNDVPTGDSGFQYIEALVASGITGGCGGGNYCPDANLTRRQMAVFLAKALGLQWQ